MKRVLLNQFSHSLNRDMHVLVYGESGVPLLAFPCQDGMCDNWESFSMPEELADFIESGKLQLFCVDTVDQESFSDKFADKTRRADVQERYYHYIVDEVVPLIRAMNPGKALPVVTGFSLGASHAAIVFCRRPDLFGGMIGCSGCYDTPHFWGDWCNATLYDNSPVHFLANMPVDHPYVELYNQRRIVLCVGQGRWENECRRTTDIMRTNFRRLGVRAWVDFWGYDVDHDWPWWKKQIRYFLPFVLEQ